MKAGIRRVILMMLCMILVGCGDGSGKHAQEEKQVPMGRYIEESAGLDDVIKDTGTAYLWKSQEGKLKALVQNKEFANYELNDSGEWEQTESALCEALNKEELKIKCIDYIQPGEAEGTYYLYGTKRIGAKESKQFVAKFMDNKLNETEMEWKDDDIILNLLVSRDEKFIVCNHSEKCIEIFNNEGKLETKLGDEAMKVALLGGKLIAMGRNKIEIYNMDTYEVEKTIEKITCDPRENEIFSDGDETAFIATSEGLFRLNKEGDLLEKVIEGELSSLASYYVIQGMKYKDEIYIGYTDYDKAFNDKTIFKKYSYHKDVPTMPDKELTIWSALPSTILKDTATIYKQKHPDIHVKIETLYNDEQYYDQCCEIKSEDLEGLSTELLAGKGPDLMILDGLPIESYKKQGILGDLASCVEKSCKEEELLENLVKSYSEDGEIYAVPLKFNLTMAIGKKEFLKDGFKLKDIAAYQEDHPDEKVMFPTVIDGRVQMMADFWQDKLFTEDGRVNKEAMTEYLAAVKKIIIPKEAWWFNDWRNNHDIATALLKDIIKVDIERATSSWDLQQMAYVLDKSPDCVIADQIEDYNSVAQAKQLIAMNSNSENKAEAEEFINIALSGDIQGCDDNDLPINLNALTERLVYNNHSRMNCVVYSEYYYDEKGELDIDRTEHDFGYQKEMKLFLETCKRANMLKPLDESIRNIIKQETKEYLEGNMPLEEAVNNLKNKINLYASEQGK